MTASAPSPAVDMTAQPLTAERPGPSRILGALDHLVASLELMSLQDPTGRIEALRALVRFFRADAAGLYVTPEPGQQMELLVAHRFPPASPRQLGVGMMTGGQTGVRSIIQMRVLDTRRGVWNEAAQEANWRGLLVYTLPRCPARLVLAYCDRAPRLAVELVNAALRPLAMAVRVLLAHGQVENLRRQTDEMNQVVTAGFNLTNSGIILLNEEGRVVTCNHNGGQFLGYGVDEVVGLVASDLLVSRSDIGPLVERVLSGSNLREEHQLTLYHRTGEPLPVRLQIVPLRLPQRPDPFGAIVLFSDLRAEPMDALEKNLQEKNARLERMISVLAHEIRNPLGSIKAGLDYLKPALSHDESASEDLRLVQGEIGRLNQLLTDALLVSRSSEPQLSPQQVTDVLDDLLTGRGKLFSEAGISVRKEYQPDLPVALVDRVQIEQVLDNLIVNAIQAMPDGGYLTIAASLNPAPTGNHYNRHPELEIKIGDSGIGIPPEIQSRIFDPFFTTKTGGTGLGLAVARRIVGQHNGTLQVESWPDAGTIFTITVPVEEEIGD